MGPLTKKNIILIPYPYSDLSDRKLRPCLVVSDQLKKDIILCQLTSNHKYEHSIELNEEDYENGSLYLRSFVRPNKLFTAHTKLVERKLCQISDKKYKEVTNKIVEIIS